MSAFSGETTTTSGLDGRLFLLYLAQNMIDEKRRVSAPLQPVQLLLHTSTKFETVVYIVV